MPADLPDPKPTEYPRETAFALGIGARFASLAVSTRAPEDRRAGWKEETERWVERICNVLDISSDHLPSSPTTETVSALSPSIPSNLHAPLTRSLLLSSLSLPTPEASNDPTTSQPEYTALARACLRALLAALGLPEQLLRDAEPQASRELWVAAKAGEAGVRDDKIKEASGEAVKERSEKGKWLRYAATGAGVVLGGVAIGLTGGLAAPALAPLLGAVPALGFLATSGGAVLIGTVFGVTGGGLTGYRVKRRVAGVSEFEFRKLGPQPEGVEDVHIEKGEEGEKKEDGSGGSLLSKFMKLNVGENVGGGGSKKKKEELEKAVDKVKEAPMEAVPSLTATICSTGLLLESHREAVTTWEPPFDTLARSDGRDSWALLYETEVMRNAGSGINSWVVNKVLGMAGKEVLKLTAAGAFLAAVSLPLSIYNTGGLLVDNAWQGAVDKSKKAGLILSDVLQQRVHGNRPLTLIGHSLGSLTLVHALLSLPAPRTPPLSSLILISLPFAPNPQQWAHLRSFTADRLVNAYAPQDAVLALVCRLHEVVAFRDPREGVRVAGLGPVSGETGAGKGAGVEDVDLSDVVGGHFEVLGEEGKMREVLEKIGLD